MKPWVQLAAVIGISCAAGSATYLIRGAPDRRVPCDANALGADEVCLGRVTGEWRGEVLWVDARSRADWRRDGVPGSVLFNIDPAEDMNQIEAEAAQRISEATRVVVYCASESCGTSRQVAGRIRAMGLGPQVYVLHGGWQALRAERMVTGSR
jgi:rhodanese-related sulfurtransferase